MDVYPQVCPDGCFSKAAKEARERTRGNCNRMTSANWLANSVQALWLIQMVGEIRQWWRIFRDVSSLANQDGTTEVQRTGDGDHIVTALATWTRHIFHAMVCIIIVISLVLWFVGALWLTTATRMNELILNSVALAFFVEIDELIYKALVPNYLDRTLQRTKMQIRIASEGLYGRCRSTSISILIILGVIAFNWIFGVFDAPECHAH